MMRSVGAVVAAVIARGVLMFVCLMPLIGFHGSALIDLGERAQVVAMCLVFALSALAGGWLAAYLANTRPVLHAVVAGLVSELPGSGLLVTMPSLAVDAPSWFTTLFLVGTFASLAAWTLGGWIVAKSRRLNRTG